MQAEQQSERAAFEVEYQLMFPVSSTVPGKFEQNGIGGYEDFQVNNAWRFWQARAAISHPSPQGWQCPKCGIERDGPFPACMQVGCPTGVLEQGSKG